MMYYVAGGAVRDLILGRSLRDVDYVFDGAEEVFIQRNPAARKIKGMIPPLYLLDGQEFSPVPHGSDALRDNIVERDFTINALLLDQNGVIRAHPQCFADLAQGIIRPASEKSLEHSPVRALRAARFAATLDGFSPHDECFALMRALPPEALAGIAAEQAGRETLKACLGGRPGNFPRVLERGGCLDAWFPELSGGNGATTERAARLMDAAALACREAELSDKERQCAVWMALCHVIGAESARQDVNPALTLGGRLRLSLRHIRAGALAARLHGKGEGYASLPSGGKVDLLMTLHKADIAEAFFLLTKVAGFPQTAEAMRSDLALVMAVSLPKDKRNRGAASGAYLHTLRRRALG